MATAYLVLVLFILAAELNIGGALKCYHCLPDVYNSCTINELTEPPTECSWQDFQNMNQQYYMNIPNVPVDSFYCIKLSVTSSVTKVLRTCAPALTYVCTYLEETSDYSKINSTCSMCDTDACNTAARTILTPVLILLFIAATVIS